MDFSRQIVVFPHTPKTAGSSVIEGFRSAFGKDRIHSMPDEKFADPTDFPGHGLHRRVRWRLRMAKRPVPSGTVLLTGHVRYGSEPETGKTPLYITLVRCPIRRMLSEYRYYGVRNGGGKNSVKRAARTLTFDGYVRHLYQFPGYWNLQCRYLFRSGAFDPSMLRGYRAIRPVEEFGAFISDVSEIVGTRISSHHTNASTRPAPEVESETLEILREMFAEDFRLHEYLIR